MPTSERPAASLTYQVEFEVRGLPWPWLAETIMAVHRQTHLPGGPGFYDVSTVFTDAAKAIGEDELLFAECFTLQDAMSAFEIGEPRLDSGASLDGDRKPPFNPLTPLLPEELCWILDRSFTCEMEWHAGNTMSQTVFTFLFVHHLDEIDPDMVPDDCQSSDPSRPLWFITVVLRAAVFGLLKCCDLAWRELMRGGMRDGEDWQGDKCDVYILEELPVKFVLAMLDDAVNLLSSSPEISAPWQSALTARILLRKSILELMNSRIHKSHSTFKGLIGTAEGLVDVIRANSSFELPSNSPATLCFDPLAARRLNAFVPFRPLQLRDLPYALDAMETLFDGWSELTVLSVTPSLSKWVLAGNLRVWLPGPPQVPYIRSSIQNAFSDGATVLNNQSLMWLVERFFIETLGVRYDTLAEVIADHWIGEDTPPLEELEQDIIGHLMSYIKGLWFNPPRRRRHLMKSLLDWHVLYDDIIKIISNTDTTPTTTDVLLRLPIIVLLWRFSIIRDVIFSGFQLELYSAEEQVYAYWYAGEVLKAHMQSVNDLLSMVEKGTQAYAELQFQNGFLSALRIMSTAMFSVMIYTPLRGEQSKINFLRRYKWAFRPPYADCENPVVAPPEWERFLDARMEQASDELYSPSDSIRLARDMFVRLSQGSLHWAGPWAAEVMQLLRMLSETCEELSALPTSMEEVLTFDITRLGWNIEKNPWFPSACRLNGGG